MKTRSSPLLYAVQYFPEKQPLRSSLPAKGDYFEFNGSAEDFLFSLFVAEDYRFHQQSNGSGCQAFI